jgi:hypothetical protein
VESYAIALLGVRTCTSACNDPQRSHLETLLHPTERRFWVVLSNDSLLSVAATRLNAAATPLNAAATRAASGRHATMALMTQRPESKNKK